MKYVASYSLAIEYEMNFPQHTNPKEKQKIVYLLIAIINKSITFK